MKESLLKNISFGSFAVITLILMVATIVEKIYGSKFAYENIYGATWMIFLWGLAATTSFIYILKQKTYKHIITFSIYISFIIILLGALTTYLKGVQGRVRLRLDEEVVKFNSSDGYIYEFPFSISLKDFELIYYKGTFAPMDYVSTIEIKDDDEVVSGVVSMNNIFKYKGYRFYQSGYDKDGKGTTLSISYDPIGITITYIGYACLLISMLTFFFQRNTTFRKLIKHPALKTSVAAFIFFTTATNTFADNKPKTLPKDIAEDFCNIHVYYNDRICPLQTLSKDFTVKLYGKTTYKGLTAEQVLTGWFFFYDDWKTEKIIKIKGDEVAAALSIDGSYACLTDFTDANGYKLDSLLQSSDLKNRKNAEVANEKFNLVSMLCTGSLLKIYPYCENETVVWYSLADNLPKSVPYEQWLFIHNSMNLVAEHIAMNDHKNITMLVDKIRKYQMKEGGNSIPSSGQYIAERAYNSTNYNKPLAMACLTIGIICFTMFCRSFSEEKKWIKTLRKILNVVMIVVLTYLTAHISLRGYVSGHVPLSNGFETMLFMAWCSALLTLIFSNRYKMALPFGFLICGFTMLVTMMGESTPQITQLMPVLQSPLLSIHVMVIMVSYCLFAFTMLNGITAIILYISRKDSAAEIEYLQIVSRIIMYPAVFLLTIGIFVGAVWANVSWGRYWGWDPKEVWALITMLIYSATLHTSSLKFLQKPINFHIYCIFAFLSVLITYFGVNYLLGGMHSYA